MSVYGLYLIIMKRKKYAIGNKYIYIFFFCLLKLSPGIINFLCIKNIIFCIPCIPCAIWTTRSLVVFTLGVLFPPVQSKTTLSSPYVIWRSCRTKNSVLILHKKMHSKVQLKLKQGFKKNPTLSFLHCSEIVWQNTKRESHGLILDLAELNETF